MMILQDAVLLLPIVASKYNKMLCLCQVYCEGGKEKKIVKFFPLSDKTIKLSRYMCCCCMCIQMGF